MAGLFALSAQADYREISTTEPSRPPSPIIKADSAMIGFTAEKDGVLRVRYLRRDRHAVAFESGRRLCGKARSVHRGDRRGKIGQALSALRQRACGDHLTRRPWKNPLLVVFCFMLAVCPCSALFW